MSSGDEDYTKGGNDDPRPTKRGRTGRACDTCRRKKIRCDLTSNPEGKCSNCAAYNYECTYVEAAKKRGPPKGYVESLENRLLRMETLLQRLCPDADFAQELGVSMDRETWWKIQNGDKTPINMQTATPTVVETGKSGGSSPTSKNRSNLKRGNNGGTLSDDFESDDDESVLPPLEEKVGQLTINLDRRFHGKSSGWVLVQTALDMKREYTGTNTERNQDLWPLWDEKLPTDAISFEFPPKDLMDTLIPLYFFHNNLFRPLLHRPSFERQYTERLHERDTGFACVLLLVCAVASKFSNDPRVLRPDPNSDQGTPPLHTAGWKYFDQVQLQRKSVTAPASLYDLQQYALAGIFLQGSESPYASWVTVGIGLRVAQDVGAHRKRHTPTTVESELWKRAFWVLVNLDRLSSAALGRPCAIHDEDFDLDPPLEVDDEYWENLNPEQAFKQPANRPSYISFFNALIKLDQILSFTLRTFYCINKSKIIHSYTDRNEWARGTLAALDTLLNRWIGSVPSHLVWGPEGSTGSNPVFFQQSAILHATYYYIQILVNRPFIPKPRKSTPNPPFTYPSLAICTNAACSAGKVFQAFLNNDCDIGASPFLMYYAFTCGLVLLLSMWGSAKPGEAGEPVAGMADVHLCMRFLKVAHDRWHLAGRLHTVLCELASVGDFPLPSPGIGTKRTRDESENSEPMRSVVTQPQRRGTTRPTKPRPTSQPPVNPQPPFNGMVGPFNPADLGAMPMQVTPSLPQGYTQNTPVPTNGGPWFPDSLPGGGSSFEAQQPSLSDVFNTSNPQTYPSSGSTFGGGFEHQSPLNNLDNSYFDPNTMMQGQENPSWDPTLNMWSMAPSGFDYNAWGSFITNIPDSRPDERQGPGPSS